MDVRGFTALSERVSPGALAELMNGFYDSASQVVIRLDGTVDKLVGDQIMAFFGHPFRPDDHASRAVEAAVEIVRAVGRLGVGLDVGGGVSTGRAFVGNVGPVGITDFTVLGDVVNVAARLQGEAEAGRVLLTEGTWDRVRERYPDAPSRELELKGKADGTTARVVVVG